MTNIDEIVSAISSAIDLNISLPNEIPAPLVAFAKNRKGLSAREVVKTIISRKNEAGAPVGALPDGTESVEEKMLYVIVQSLLEHVIQNAKITVSIPPGTPVVGTGITGAGVPVTINGYTTDFAKGYAVIQ